MGTLIGHVAPGIGFFLIGLWHLFNHTKLFALNSHKYRSSPWFPSALLRHLELYVILFGCLLFVLMEFFISPDRHSLFDPDGTIGSNHLHNFEHVFMSVTFLVYAALALAFDNINLFRSRSSAHEKFLLLVAAMAFAQELLLFHVHSTDHVGVEGQYHWLLQLVIAVAVATTLLGIPWPRSFVVGFARSLSIMCNGLWTMLMGFMLWTPGLIPKGCFMHEEEGHTVVRCDGEESLHRAKSLVNIEFSWFLIALTLFAVSFYMLFIFVYSKDVEYLEVDLEEDDDKDVEAQRIISKFVGETKHCD